MRISDWSSDVCSSDLQAVHALGHRLMRAPTEAEIAEEMGMMLPEYQELLEEARGVQIIHYEDLVRHTEDKQHPLDHQTRSADTQSAQWANPLNQLVSNGLRKDRKSTRLNSSH